MHILFYQRTSLIYPFIFITLTYRRHSQIIAMHQICHEVIATGHEYGNIEPSTGSAERCVQLPMGKAVLINHNANSFQSLPLALMN